MLETLVFKIPILQFLVVPDAMSIHKAELLQEGIIFLIHLFARAILLMKKLKIKDHLDQLSELRIIKVGLVLPISNFFINKIALANIWMSFSFSN